MPTYHGVDIPKPKSWDEFEVICWDLFRAIWKDETTLRHGRQGQPQHGVDVYGRPNQKQNWEGVQCKGKTSGYGNSVSESELKREVNKAKTFEPQICNFILVTTAPRDAKIQKFARKLTDEHLANGLFTVSVWGWEDICERLAHYPDILKSHWPGFFQTNVSVKDIEKVVGPALEAALDRRAANTTTQAVAEITTSPAFPLPQQPQFQNLEPEHQAEVDQARDLLNSHRPKSALAILEKLRDRIWSQTTSSVKFRIITNIGACHLKLNRYEKAANSFIEALQYNPHDEKALQNAATASILNKNPKDAKQYVTKVLRKNKANPSAWSIQIQATENSTEFDVLCKKVPASIRYSEEVSAAIAQKLVSQTDFDRAAHEMRTSLKKNSDASAEFKAFLADVLLQLLFKDKSLLVTGELNEPQIAIAQESLKYYTEAWNQIVNTEVAETNSGWLINRGVVNQLLKNEFEAARDTDQSLALNPNEIQAKKNRVLFLINGGKTKDAELFLAKHPPALDDYELRLLHLSLLLRLSKFPAAKALIDELKDPSKPERVRREAAILEIESDRIARQFDVSLAKCSALRQQYPGNARLMAIHARVYRSAGKAQEAVALLVDAYNHVTPDEETLALVELADELYHSQKFPEAASLYERFVGSDVQSEYAQRLLISYMRSGNSKKALDLCKKARKAGTTSQVIVDTESRIYEEIGDFAGARESCERYLKDNSSDVEVRLRLALVNFKDGRIEEVDSFLDAITDEEVGLGARLALPYASLLHRRGRYEHAIAYLYEVRRVNFRIPEVHLQYVFGFLMTPQKSNFNFAASEVKPGFAFCVQESDQNKTWYIIDDRNDTELKSNELSSSHPVAKAALGQTVGAVLEMDGPFARKEIGKILEIKHRYLFALHESMSKYSTMFPETPGLQEFSIDKTDPLGSISKMLEISKKSEERRSKIEEFYLAGQMTLGGFSQLTGKTAIEVWGYLVNEPELPVIASNGLRQLDLGVDLSKAEFVIDPIAILTLHYLEVQSALQQSVGRLMVSRSTLQLFKHAAESNGAFRDRGYMTVFETTQGLARQEVSPEDIKKSITFLETIVHWIEIACTVLPCEAVLEINAERRANLADALGGSAFLETVVLASSKHVALISDDFAFRMVSNGEFQVSTFCTQDILFALLNSKRISQDEFDRSAVKLCSAKYQYTVIGPGALLIAAKQANWSIGFPFDRTVRVLGGKNADVTSSFRVAIAFIHQLWYEPCLPFQRDNLILAVFDTLARDKKRSEIAKSFRSIIEQFFQLLPLAQKHLLGLIDSWLAASPIEY